MTNQNPEKTKKPILLNPLTAQYMGQGKHAPAISKAAIVFLFLLACQVSPIGAAEITFSKENDHFLLSWPADTPAWRLQYTTNLSPPNWITLTNFSVTNATYSVIEPGADPVRFYRLYQKPASEEQP